MSGESIVRNLMYGIRDCMAFGEPMKIGYLPDSFGMSGQLPHIYNGFGITRTMFWRGCSERHGTDKTEFLWQSGDGSEVTAQVLPLGYAIGKYLPEDEAGCENGSTAISRFWKRRPSPKRFCCPTDTTRCRCSRTFSR